MIDDTARAYIFNAVEAELEMATKHSGKFHSHHEAWAVLQEECEEVEDAYHEFANIVSDQMMELVAKLAIMTVLLIATAATILTRD